MGSVGRRAGGPVLAACCGLLLLAAPAYGQVAVGDSLWRLGKTSEAAAAYRRAVELDQSTVRGDLRIAQALAWSNQTDSALAHIRAARAQAPDDVDLRFAEATYLGWAHRYDEALLKFDSILAMTPDADRSYVRVAHARTLSWAGRLDEAEAGYRAALEDDPGDRDARFGLAQLRAWSGDLDGAEAGYLRLAEEDSTETRLLVAMAQLRLWQGRSGAAEATLGRVPPSDTALADVAGVRRAVREARATTVSLSSAWSRDGDENHNRWQILGAQGMAGDATKVTVTLGYLDATDPFRSSDRMMAEVGFARPVGNGTITAAVGARNIDPPPLDPADPRPDGRVALTGRVGLRQRVAPGLTLGAAVSRWPFDEIAVLMALALDVDQVDLTADWRVTPAVTFSGVGSRLAFSDGNVRLGWTGRVAWQLRSGTVLGLNGTVFGFDVDAPRYFSPDAFRAVEITAGWGRETPTWTTFLDSGFGAQKVADASSQRQWHVDVRASRKLGDRWWVEAGARSSNSAAATAIGAYGYDVVSLGLRRTF